MLNNAGNIWKQFIKKVKGQFIKLVKITSCKFTHLCRDKKIEFTYINLLSISAFQNLITHYNGIFRQNLYIELD